MTAVTVHLQDFPSLDLKQRQSQTCPSNQRFTRQFYKCKHIKDVCVALMYRGWHKLAANAAVSLQCHHVAVPDTTKILSTNLMAARSLSYKNSCSYH